MDTPSHDAVEPGKAEPASFWSKYGCLIGLGLTYLLAIPVWMIAFPESYDRAVAFVVDAFAVFALIGTTVLFLVATVRSRKNFPPLGCVVALVSVALASLASWNLIALYTKSGTVPLMLFGWEFSARPGFYVWLFIVVLGLAATTSNVLGKVRPKHG